MKKTKIICSIGPSSDDYNTLVSMVNAGMNVARINFSHGNEAEWLASIQKIKQINNDLNTNIGILFDTKGPDFRLGMIEHDHIKLIPGKKIKISKKQLIGNKECLSVNYPQVLDKIEEGATILLEDGLLELKVMKKSIDELECEVITGGLLSNCKSISVPGVDLKMEFISKGDVQDIIFACKNNADFLALSFVNSKEDVLLVKDILKKHDGSDIQIIAKIESEASFYNIDEIIKVADGIMVARGDLGVEMPMAELPILQKEIINKCNKAGKISIVATEMLASMYTNSRPSRAEISDVANAVLDGTDAVMLSGETTVGKYPILATKYMAEACISAESYYDYHQVKNYKKIQSIPLTIAHSVITAANLLEANLIIAATKSGYTAKLISNLKPKPLILATCVSHQVARSLSLSYGVYTQVVGLFVDFEDIIMTAKANAMALMNLNAGDTIIITGGTPILNKEKTTNFMKIERI